MNAFRITRAEKAAIIITLLFASFVAGFFFGRKTVKPVIPDSAEAEASVYVYDSTSDMISASEQTSAAGTAEQAGQTAGSAEENEADTNSAAEGSTAVWTTDSGVRLDLNQASLEELENLPAIGPVLAQAILDYRQENGSFQTVDDLLNVDGIGEKTLEKVRQYVTAGDGA